MDKKITESIKSKDLERMRDLPCCKQGMTFHECFENIVSYCEKCKEDLEKWYQKRKNQK